MQNQDEGKLAPKGDDEEILAEARALLEYDTANMGDNIREARDDLLFLKGGENQWSMAAKAERVADRRPMLTINKLPTFLHQVTNDQRMNTPRIKIHAVDSESDPKTAEVLQGLVRHIEYASNADVAYDRAVNSAARIGFGYFRLITGYCDEASFDQDIKFQSIRNPFTVHLGPHQEPDGSDLTKAMISVRMPKSEFKRLYPKASMNVDQLGTRDAANWIDEQEVRVAEYYRVHEKTATLIQLSNGEVGYKDDLLALPPGVTVVAERSSSKREVQWFKTNGVEVLERAVIPCRWIPIFPVYGEEIDVDGRVYRSGIIRHAKDPAKMYNFWMTTATEEIALRPKSPFIGAEGTFEGHKQKWMQANHRSFPYLEYKPVSLGGQLAPPPQRQPMADIPSGALQMMLHANDNIKATTGLFDSSLGARGSATSGVQERQQQRQGDMANFHYTDGLNRAIRHAGRCIINMVPSIYDTERVVRLLGEDGSATYAEVNKPVPPEEQQPDPKTGAIQTILNDLTVGTYDVTVDSGPSYDTLRQEAAENMIELGGRWPKLMEVAGDKVVKAMDWPMADEIAERIANTIPMEVRQTEEERKAGGMLPPEVQAQMQQMQAQMQQMQQLLQEAQSGIEKARIDAESRERVAEINAVAKQDVEELKGVIQLLLAKMQPSPELTAQAMQTGENDASRPVVTSPTEPAQSEGLPADDSTGQEFAQ